MVRICLLDGYDSRLTALQTAKSTKKELGIHPIHHVRPFIGHPYAYTMFTLFVAGNIFYYAVGITLAILLKDNRAFCKYICPITVFLKPMSYYSLIRIKCDEDKCISCGKCLKVCPMEVEVNKNARSRKNATECILCQKCTKACPTKALSV